MTRPLHDLQKPHPHLIFDHLEAPPPAHSQAPEKIAKNSFSLGAIPTSKGNISENLAMIKERKAALKMASLNKAEKTISSEKIMKLLEITTEEEHKTLEEIKTKYKLTNHDIIKKVKEMKKASIKSEYLNLLDMGGVSKNPDYTALSTLLSLRSMGMKYEEVKDMIDVSTMPNMSAQAVVDIAKERQASGNINIFDYFSYIYHIAKDTEKNDFMAVHQIAKLLNCRTVYDLYSFLMYKRDNKLTCTDITKKVEEMKKVGITTGYLEILPVVENEDQKWALVMRVFNERHPGLINKLFTSDVFDMREKTVVRQQKIGERNTMDRMDFIQFINKQKPAMQDMLIHLVDRVEFIDLEGVQNFIADPSLSLCCEIYEKMNNMDPEEALRFGRSLFLRGINVLPDKDTLNKFLKRFYEVQAKADKIKIFEGRNIVGLFNSEVFDRDITDFKKGEKRFDSEERKRDMAKSIGPMPPGHFSPHAPANDIPTVEDLRKVKADTLREIEVTPPPMTFFFDGHGGPDALYMNHGQVEGGIPKGENVDKITVQELAGAMSRRKEKYAREDLYRDIFINAGCFNNTFIRNLYSGIKSSGGVPPIAIGEAEFGQLGQTNKNKYKTMYQLGKLGTTIGHLRENELKYLSSNFTIFVPDENGDIFQVAMNEPAAPSSGETKPT